MLEIPRAGRAAEASTGRRRLGAALLAAAFAALFAPQASWTEETIVAAPRGSVADNWGMLETYCVGCHNFEDWAGGVAFDVMTPDSISEQPDVWEHAILKLSGGLMPPPGNPRPDAETAAAFLTALESELDQAAARAPNPGYVDLRRLSRREYATAVRDLLAVELDPATLLPKDNTQDGYDNIAAVLSISPTFLEQYVSAARRVAAMAIGDAGAGVGSATYFNPSTSSYKRHVDGLPMGTRGGFVVEHAFPADGHYRVNISDMATARYSIDMEFENTIVVTLDGRKVYETTIGGEDDLRSVDQNGVSAADFINLRLKDIPIEATAGVHDVGVTFLERSFAESDQLLQAFVPGGGHDRVLDVASFEVVGPFEVAGVSDTESRRRIFTCYPAAEEEEPACAEEILGRFARLAYRRPVEENELGDLMRIYASAADEGGFEFGVQRGLSSILASPKFLFRYFSPPDEAQPGTPYEIGDIELASRLSFFLWSSMPDDELLTVAEAGRLRDPAALEHQVRRMLADEKAHALATDFALQWLDIEALDDVVPDPRIFPNASERDSGDPRYAYKRELELFISSIIREDRSIIDLLTADHTYVNERVALLYGIDDVRGDQFRRVTLTDPVRFGLLGKGAVLMATSYPNRTAPVLRGKYILDNILGTPPAPPPPGVDTDLTESDVNARPSTIRERLEIHRADESCNGCHGVMDPLGLALENFDAIGEWREIDRFSHTAIDASGALPDGTALNSPNDLREVLAGRPEQFARTLAGELMTYALGRSLEPHDMPAVRRIAARAAESDYAVSAIILGVVESDQFRMMMVPEDETPIEGAVLTP